MLQRFLHYSIAAAAACILGFGQFAHASGVYTLEDAQITSLAVNGGADTVNPGTSCIRVSAPVASTSSNGYVAIPNNNKQLLSAAFQAKAAGNKLWLYYADTGNFHCPGRVFTPCGAISIELLP